MQKDVSINLYKTDERFRVILDGKSRRIFGVEFNFNDVRTFGRENDTEICANLGSSHVVIAPKVGKPFLVRFGEGCQRFSRENVTDLCEKTWFSVVIEKK